MSSSGRTDGRTDRELAFFARYYADQTYNPTGWRLRMERDLRLVLRELGHRSSGRVLSVGCGDGGFECLLARHVGHVTGIDISPEAIAAAGRHAAAAGLENLEFRRAAALDWDWGRDLDAVLCLGFLHHLSEEQSRELLAQAREHLAPDGLLLAMDPNARAALRKVGRVLLGSRYHRYHTPDERELDPDALRETLLEMGFRDVRLLPVDFTLVPATYVLARGPGWPLRACALLDRLLLAAPLDRWASGFGVVARR